MYTIFHFLFVLVFFHVTSVYCCVVDESLFADPEVIRSVDTLKKAGFETKGPQQWSRIIVAKHEKAPGYLFKIYVDEEKYPGSRCDFEYWQRRIEGAQKVAQEIVKRDVSDRFKVPQKWIYKLSREGKARNFILIVEDMDLLDETANISRWGGETVSKELLANLWEICEAVGLRDSLKPDNIPFCKDGKIAFIDTEQHGCWPLRAERLTPFLREDLRGYWEELVKERQGVY